MAIDSQGVPEPSPAPYDYGYLPSPGQGQHPLSHLPLMFMLDNADSMETIEHLMRGEVALMKDGQITGWSKEGEALLNDRGIRWVMALITTHTTKNTNLTSLDEETIRAMCMDICKLMRNTFMLKYDEYGIKKENFSFIKNIAIDFIYTTLQRGKNALTLSFLADTTRQEMRQIFVEGGSEKKGVLGKLGGSGIGKFMGRSEAGAGQ